MNLEEQKVNGINAVMVSDSLNAPLTQIKVKLNANTIIPDNDELIIYVDTATPENPTSERKQFVFDIWGKLRFFEGISDEFLTTIKIKDSDVILESTVLSRIGENVDGLYVSEYESTIVVQESMIELFEGLNYIYTNYVNADIEIVYPKNNELNKQYLNNSIYLNHKKNNKNEFSLDDLYFKDAFTKSNDKLYLEVEDVKVSTISSKNNKFSLDSDGNLVVNSITTSSQNTTNNGNVCDLIYPIGSIYMSVSNVSPSILFGGTWEQIKDKFLLSAGDTYNLGATGGEASHTLTTNEMPSHSHTFSQSSCTNPGNHTHIVGADKDGGGGTNRYTVHITSNNTASGQQYSPVSGAAGGHTHTINGTNTNTGGSQAHNNMPPYLTVNVWKRTA